ncbi:hypothetical protein LH61_06425 [Leuconostoc mesenteroides P45]|uniref:WxL domain-containing protein n=1 Tax=Leuconostoc mesenteroides TaxID=1245 RepID=UPI000500821D|nr:WxL domain-containing protein [Leuconostoc mesenteroides]KGB51105.1 hypothetical protein LH61_06425 [Leuconostoc mesenteroides P45]
MNKKILSLVGLSTLGLSLMPAVAFADTLSPTLNSNAKVIFTEDDTQKSPLDPTTPANSDNTQNAISPIDTVTGDTPNAGTKGPLSLDFASSFNFGSHDISSVDKAYQALPQSYTQKDDSKATDTTGPNFAQVTDVRSGAAKGWTLNVKMNDDFKAQDGTVLKGAIINIKNGTAVNGNGGTSTISSVAPSITLSTADSTVMGAKATEGYGTWLYTMGNKDTAGSSVTLTVPGASSKVADAYTTQLVWTLSDTAVQ